MLGHGDCGMGSCPYRHIIAKGFGFDAYSGSRRRRAVAAPGQKGMWRTLPLVQE
jgi:hypothetical protein